ncbi:Transcriptional regulator, AbiEi antitoxin, Type IV TA system [Lachnospiraceae bacterium NE2001]|nr:Transcriptional regulator, AbiEi antitoxin, Type IV TA system [Lachnospiraceae bacterium NE2001]
MIMTYKECLKKYKNDYQIRKAIDSGYIKKLESGIYSDKDFEFETTIISKKYPKAVFTMNSAFYYLGLTDSIPDKYHLVTDKDASKISDQRVVQYFDNFKSLELGMIDYEVDGELIRMYGNERMLLELFRNKKRLPYDYYKEIIQNYRKRIEKMDIAFIQDMAQELPKSDFILDAFETEVL